MSCSLSLQVYYPVRHHLVQHMISAMQRLGFTPSVTIEQRKLAVDLAEVIIKWELQRIKDQQVGAQWSLLMARRGTRAAMHYLRTLSSLIDGSRLPGWLGRGPSVRCGPYAWQLESEGDAGASGEGTSVASGSVKRGLSVDSGQDVKRFRTATGAAVGTVTAAPFMSSRHHNSVPLDREARYHIAGFPSWHSPTAAPLAVPAGVWAKSVGDGGGGFAGEACGEAAYRHRGRFPHPHR